MFSKLKELMNEVLDHEVESFELELELELELGLDDDLADFGINSLNFIHLLVALEETYNIEFVDEELEFENLNTLRKLNCSIESLINMD